MSERPVTPTRRISGTILALDYGSRRIGVAVGETTTATATALCTLPAHGREPDWNALERCLAEWRPQCVLVGVPHHPDGTEGTLAPAARAFAAELSRRFDIAVDLVDEQLTTRAAREELRELRGRGALRRRVRRGDADRIAARLILEAWLHAPADAP